MGKYICKGFDTMSELTEFLNKKGIKKENIIHIFYSEHTGHKLIYLS